MLCPKCRTDIAILPDPGGFLTCPGCGARLMTRPAARVGEDTLRTTPRPAPPPPPAQVDTPTPVAGTPAIAWPPAEEPPVPAPTTLEQVLAELQAIRETQAEVLALLRARPGRAGGVSDGAAALDPTFLAGAQPRVRTRKRKTVLLIDDDPATRQAALAEMEQAQVPARVAADGAAGIQAIAAEKPDVIALELGMGGNMAGKDVINMIKATMEWVDIPILLYTRLPVESQKEARSLHGADDLVLKRSGPAALVSRVIATFRRTP
jgi:CheY-like chemotaxis protein